MDWYCLEDTTLWINLEQYVVKKENIFSLGRTMIF